MKHHPMLSSLSSPLKDFCDSVVAVSYTSLSSNAAENIAK
jgi:hypothetical protein